MRVVGLVMGVRYGVCLAKKFVNVVAMEAMECEVNGDFGVGGEDGV